MLEVENQRVQGGGEKVASGIKLQEREVEGEPVLTEAGDGGRQRRKRRTMLPGAGCPSALGLLVDS